MNYDGVFTLTKFYENRGEWVPVGATYDEEKAVAWQNQDPDKYGFYWFYIDNFEEID